MKLGLFTMPLHTLKLGYKEMYDQDLEAALLCDRLGFEEYWLGEHTSAKVEPISDALQFMSALLPQTRKLVFGTGVLNLPQHFPPLPEGRLRHALQRLRVAGKRRRPRQQFEER